VRKNYNYLGAGKSEGSETAETWAGAGAGTVGRVEIEAGAGTAVIEISIGETGAVAEVAAGIGDEEIKGTYVFFFLYKSIG
jgi:hypothetical protein